MTIKTLKELQLKRYKIKHSLLYKLFPKLFKCKLKKLKIKSQYCSEMNKYIIKNTIKIN